MLNGPPENKAIDPRNPNQKIIDKAREIDKLADKLTSTVEVKPIETKQIPPKK